jgi:predicted enzyme related to lactoylglutathione lyase
MMDRIFSVVMVRDMDRAMRFYRDTLGLHPEEEQEDWAFFSEGIGLMMSDIPIGLEDLRMNSVILTLRTENIEESFRDLMAKGVVFSVPPADVGGAKVASFNDSEGNYLQLIQFTD